MDSPGTHGLEQTTILALALGVSSSLFINGTNLQQQILSPLSFQGGPLGAVTNASFRVGAILLHGMPPECPRTHSVTKMYLILKFEGVGTQDFCGGVIAKGGDFCTRKDCSYSSHRIKAWDGNGLKPGFYIVNLTKERLSLSHSSRWQTSMVTLRKICPRGWGTDDGVLGSSLLASLQC